MKPQLSPVWSNVSIFVYDKPGSTTTPVATVLNRKPGKNNKLFFTDLRVTGSVNKGGFASFKVYDTGYATESVKGLFTDDYIQEGFPPTEKYVAIICGQSVIWSGKISKSINQSDSSFNATLTQSVWEVQCESDIAKMKLQSVNVPANPVKTGTLGKILEYLFRKKDSGDIDWTGYHPSSAPPRYESIISYEGGELTYTIQDTDMYSQFINLANTTGFEWRTRLVTWIEDYTDWDYVDFVLSLTNISSFYTQTELDGRWVLFLGEHGEGSPITTYGRITYDADDIVLTDVVNPLHVPVTNGTAVPCVFTTQDYVYTSEGERPAVDSIVSFTGDCPPNVLPGRNYLVKSHGVAGYWRISASDGADAINFGIINNIYQGSTYTVNTVASARCVVLFDPVIDVVWDLEQKVPVLTTNLNLAASQYQNFCYGFVDSTDRKKVATKVTVKAKNIDTSLSPTGKSETISTTLMAQNKWDMDDAMFENTTIVTRKMDGYIYSCAANTAILYIIGQDYAVQVGDVFDCWCKWVDPTGSSTDITPTLVTGLTVSAVTNFTQADGTKTLKITFTGDPAYLHATYNVAKYSVFSPRKMYVQDPSRVYSSGTTRVWCGGATSTNKPAYKDITATGADSSRGKYISGTSGYDSAISAVRPAFPGCLVSLNRSGEYPKAGSPLALLGLIIYSQTVDQAVTLGDLEMYATQALINRSFYTRKAQLKTPFNSFLKPSSRGYGQDYDWTPVQEGDRICVNPGSVLPTGDSLTSKYFDGQYKYMWEVVEWTLNTNDMQVSVLLGDTDRDLFNLISDKTTSVEGTIT